MTDGPRPPAGFWGRRAIGFTVSATALFAVPATGPGTPITRPPRIRYSYRADRADRPGAMLLLDEIDIGSHDDGSGTEFVAGSGGVSPRRCPTIRACTPRLPVYVTDIYGVDPVLAVHGHSMTDRGHHAATTDVDQLVSTPTSADPLERAESYSPAADRGRG